MFKEKALYPYNHQAWLANRRILRFLLKTIGFTWLVKLDRIEGLENIPDQGPVITLINHIAFVDPLVIVYVAKRDIVPLAKIEVYNLPLLGIFPRLWGVIPIRRDQVDRRALRWAMSVLKAGESLLVAPEGTRSNALQPAKEGAAYLASRSGAAVVPVAIQGTVGFPAFRFSDRWKQSGVSVRFGEPFRFKPGLIRARGNMLQKMTDEAMYVLAKMLPEKLRGVYADLSKATQETFEWL